MAFSLPFVTAPVAAIGKLFGNEIPKNPEMTKMIVNTLKTLHISCAFDCLEAARSSEDFIGLCVFHKEGEQLLEDNGRRIKSGYIFVSKTSTLDKLQANGSNYHRRLYNMLFKEIEHFQGVTIVGFSQQNNRSLGRSGTFNTDNCTNLYHRDSKDCLYIFRTLIFGALIMFKLTGKRNVSPHSSALSICLFLIIKNQGDQEQLAKFPVSDLDLQDRSEFTKEMLASLDVHKRILDIAFDYNDFTWLTRWLRVQYALKLVLNDLRSDISAAEFGLLLNCLLRVFDGIDSVVQFLRSLILGRSK